MIQEIKYIVKENNRNIFFYKLILIIVCIFYSSPLIVPPAVPVIYNEQNEPIESRAGPYEEGGQLILTCVVMGGENKRENLPFFYSEKKIKVVKEEFDGIAREFQSHK